MGTRGGRFGLDKRQSVLLSIGLLVAAAVWWIAEAMYGVPAGLGFIIGFLTGVAWLLYILGKGTQKRQLTWQDIQDLETAAAALEAVKKEAREELLVSEQIAINNLKALIQKSREQEEEEAGAES